MRYFLVVLEDDAELVVDPGLPFEFDEPQPDGAGEAVERLFALFDPERLGDYGVQEISPSGVRESDGTASFHFAIKTKGNS